MYGNYLDGWRWRDARRAPSRCRAVRSSISGRWEFCPAAGIRRTSYPKSDRPCWFRLEHHSSCYCYATKIRQIWPMEKRNYNNHLNPFFIGHPPPLILVEEWNVEIQICFKSFNPVEREGERHCAQSGLRWSMAIASALYTSAPSLLSWEEIGWAFSLALSSHMYYKCVAHILEPRDSPFRPLANATGVAAIFSRFFFLLWDNLTQKKIIQIVHIYNLRSNISGADFCVIFNWISSSFVLFLAVGNIV